MNRVIYETPEAWALCEDDCLAEYIPRCDAGGADSIYIGKVDRIMKGLDCAFVDIGRSRSGFLPLHENSRTFQGEELRSGAWIPVQVKKEETGEKGAFLTRDLSLAGTWVILMPMNRFVGVSKKIRDEDTVLRLKEAGRRISDGQFGLVMRESSAGVQEEDLRTETEELLAEWKKLEQIIPETRKAGVIRQETALQRLIHDYQGKGGLEIRKTERLPEPLKEQLRNALKRKVELKHGGNLVFDECEAMHVIDVNTASRDSRSGKEMTILETNLEACDVLALQMRLRNLSGIILIDFVDMDREEDREAVQERLQEALARDRIKTVVHGWTRLGLIEMTRRRTGITLSTAMTGGMND